MVLFVFQLTSGASRVHYFPNNICRNSVFKRFIATWQITKCGNPWVARSTDTFQPSSLSCNLTGMNRTQRLVDYPLHAISLKCPQLWGTVLLKLASIAFHTEGRVLNVYTLCPCLVSCYVIAANALVRLHINYEEEGDIAKRSLGIISTKKAHFAKVWDPIIRSQRKSQTGKGLSL